jgi:ABC-type nitrate/sulfonate/bicarbonate transport system permease component
VGGILTMRALALARRCWLPLVLVALWQAWIEASAIPRVVAPGPVAALQAVGSLVSSDVGSITSTCWLAAVGLLAGMLFGVGLAVAGWFSSTLDGVMAPFALILRSIPILAMLPLIAAVVGYNERVVLAATTLISFFPAFTFTATGLRSAPAGAPDYFQALGAGRGRQLRHLALPSAAPNILLAFKLSAAASFTAAITAQYLAGSSGLGYQLGEAQYLFEVPRAWAISLIVICLSVAAFGLGSLAERWGVSRYL